MGWFSDVLCCAVIDSFSEALDPKFGYEIGNEPEWEEKKMEIGEFVQREFNRFIYINARLEVDEFADYLIHRGIFDMADLSYGYSLYVICQRIYESVCSDTDGFKDRVDFERFQRYLFCTERIGEWRFKTDVQDTADFGWPPLELREY